MNDDLLSTPTAANPAPARRIDAAAPWRRPAGRTIAAGCGRRLLAAALGALLTAGAAGCGALTVAQRNQALGALGIGGLGRSPSTDLEQLYYLGAFDPQDQLPPTIYRIRVRGQASALNFTRYASGWVPAAVIDSLSSQARFDKADGSVQVDESASKSERTIEAGRRLVLFGPEGFREAPKDHRLVILMGSDPDAFFQGVDQALGSIALLKQAGASAPVQRLVQQALGELRAQRRELDFVGASLK